MPASANTTTTSRGRDSDCSTRARALAPLPLLERRRTGQGDGLVDPRCVTADADRADYLAVEPYRDTALKRRAVGQGQRGHTPGPDLLLEVPTRPSVDGCRPGLADADVDARDLRVVQAVEKNEVTAVVDDRDDDADTACAGLLCCLRRDLRRRLERPGLLVYRLGRRRHRNDPAHDDGHANQELAHLSRSSE